MDALKDRIIAEYEATKAGTFDVSRALNCSYDYACHVLRLHRGNEDHRGPERHREADGEHIERCILAGGFPHYLFRPALRIRP